MYIKTQEVADPPICDMGLLKASREKSFYKVETCFSAFTATSFDSLRSFQADMAETRQNLIIATSSLTHRQYISVKMESKKNNSVKYVSNVNPLLFNVNSLIVLGLILYLPCQIT
jgi:hypothetical protein